MANSTVVSVLLIVQELLTESFILYSTPVRPKCRSLVIKTNKRTNKRVTPFFAFSRFCRPRNTVTEAHRRFVSQALGKRCERPKLERNKAQRSGQE